MRVRQSDTFTGFVYSRKQSPKEARMARGPKALGQACLKRMGIYHRLTASVVYDVYWKVFNRSLIDDRDREVAFYQSLLKGFRAGDLIYDVGANLGYKTNIFLKLGARVVAVDPDPSNKRILEESFLRFRIVPKPVTVIGKAASDRSAVATLFVDEPGSAKNTLSQKWVDSLREDTARFGQTLSFKGSQEIQTTTLDEIVKDHGNPFFIKIDVEGHEPGVLRGLNRPVPYLSYEVNLPEFRSEGLECVAILNKLEPQGRFNYGADCRQGLLLTEWLDAETFSTHLRECKNPSIEVFWKTQDAA